MKVSKKPGNDSLEPGPISVPLPGSDKLDILHV